MADSELTVICTRMHLQSAVEGRGLRIAEHVEVPAVAGCFQAKSSVPTDCCTVRPLPGELVPQDAPPLSRLKLPPLCQAVNTTIAGQLKLPYGAAPFLYAGTRTRLLLKLPTPTRAKPSRHSVTC
jgi:hypothetical protein